MKRFATIIVLSLAATLCLALLASGCGSKKNKTKTAKDTDAGVADTSSEEEVAQDTGAEQPQDTGEEQAVEPPAPVKGPAVFPPAPANDFPNRQTREYLLSVKKAQILPAKEDGQCWDDCAGESATLIGGAISKLGALPPASQSSFDLPAKALQMGVGAVGGADALPDVFVHIRCGHGQGHMTNKKGSKDKIIATWTYENKAFNLDDRDECAISLWEADDDGDEEIGRTVVPLVQLARANGNKAIIYGAEVGFGQVYSLEIGLTPKSEVPANPSAGKGDENVPKAQYTVEVVKAEIKKTKKDGKEWDASAKQGGGGLLGALAGAASAVDGKDPDVYVEAWFNGYLSQAPFVTTTVKKENYYPAWGETGGLTLKDTDFINFMVWDKDLAQPDLIGECKTKPLGQQGMGEIKIENCGQVVSLIVRVTKN